MTIIKVGRKTDNDWRSSDLRVSGYHCTVTVSDNGRISVEDHSTNGTFFNGKKKSNCTFSVQKTDVISLAGIVDVSISEILAAKKPIPAETKKKECAPTFNLNVAKTYTDFRKVLNDHKQLSELKSYRDAVENSKADLPSYVMPSIIAAIAAKEMRSNHLREAQKLLYQAGKMAYADLDGTPQMENCYAAMMALLSELYSTAYHFDVAEKAGRFAVGIFARWEEGNKKISVDARAYALSVYAAAMKSNGKHEDAKAAYKKALDAYNSIAASNPQLYAAKIREIEDKLQ